MKMTPKEEADKLWKIHTYYFNEPELEAKQKIVLQIAGIIRALQIYNVNDIDYWQQVSLEVYNK